MLSWKLLGDLLPQELRLECERAGIKASQKDSHNFVKLAKYILSNGYDPEEFYFNTIYKTDKSDPLFGMMNGSAAKASDGGVRVLSPFTASGLSSSTVASGTSAPPPSDGTSTALFELFTKMSQDIQKMVSIMEVKETVIASGVGVDRSKHRSSPPDLPVWDSVETMSSSSSSSGYYQSFSSQSSSSSGYSGSSEFFGRHYNKSLLIKDGICLAYQHGNCSYGGQTKHENAYGKNVLHVCGLCWTDSPHNQCHSPAVQCPGPEHNL